MPRPSSRVEGLGARLELVGRALLRFKIDVSLKRA